MHTPDSPAEAETPGSSRRSVRPLWVISCFGFLFCFQSLFGTLLDMYAHPHAILYSTLIGGSRPRRAKAPVNRGRRQNPPRDQSNRRRLHHYQYNEDRDVYVHPTSVTKVARQRAAARLKKDKEMRREAAKRLKFSQLETLKGLKTLEYIEMRVMDFYNMERTSRLPTFWRTEHELFMKDIYKKLKSNKVCLKTESILKMLIGSPRRWGCIPS